MFSPELPGHRIARRSESQGDVFRAPRNSQSQESLRSRQKYQKQRSSGSNRLKEKSHKCSEGQAEIGRLSIRKNPTSTNSSNGRSNLESFLDHTMPAAECQYPAKTSSIDAAPNRWKFQAETGERMAYFNLGDLWSSFDEYSAYGAGVPLTLPSGEAIVQYYVPYLSALQIYSRAGFTLISKQRLLGDDSDWSDASDMRDTGSEFSSDNENDKVCTLLMRKENLTYSVGKICNTARCVEDSSSERSSLEEASCERHDGHGDLIFEYFERCSPHGRAPLSGKISELAAGFPHLLSLRSNELSSASWVSIAWYPIYRIPTGPTMRELATCFLTYHSLWTPSSRDEANPCEIVREFEVKDRIDPSENESRTAYESRARGIHRDRHEQLDSSLRGEELDSSLRGEELLAEKLSTWRIESGRVELPAFGLASYKLRGPFWALAASSDRRRVTSLASSANLWLKYLRVQHPDFDFFAGRGT